MKEPKKCKTCKGQEIVDYNLDKLQELIEEREEQMLLLSEINPDMADYYRVVALNLQLIRAQYMRKRIVC